MSVIKYSDEVRVHRSTTLTETFTHGQDLEREEDTRSSGRERVMKKFSRHRNTVYSVEHKRGDERRDICFKYRDTGKCKFDKEYNFKHEGDHDSEEGSDEDIETECHVCCKSGHKAEKCKIRKETVNPTIIGKERNFRRWT